MNNKPLILVVEDDSPVRNLIVTTLKTHDYKYITAENGNAAIMEASSHNPEIVLLDLGLPDIDGIQASEEIKKLNFCKWQLKNRLRCWMCIFRRRRITFNTYRI